jgi:hypothetical protein
MNEMFTDSVHDSSEQPCSSRGTCTALDSWMPTAGRSGNKPAALGEINLHADCPAVRKRRDPFGWMFAAIATMAVAGIPLYTLAIPFGRTAVASVMLSMLAVAVTLAGTAPILGVRELVRRHQAKFSLQNLFAAMLACALLATVFASTEPAISIGALMTLYVWITAWWSWPANSSSRLDFLTQWLGNALGVGTIVLCGYGLIGTIVWAVLTRHVR